jgi:hypothetical protein
MAAKQNFVTDKIGKIAISPDEVQNSDSDTHWRLDQHAVIIFEPC